MLTKMYKDKYISQRRLCTTKTILYLLFIHYTRKIKHTLISKSKSLDSLNHCNKY